MRILTTESKLRRLPTAVDPRQGQYLDGIRYAIEMFDVAYERLVYDLCQRGRQDAAPAQTSFAGTFLDAWSAIDSLHRLREIVSQTPHFKKKSPPLVAFLLATSRVEDMRHFAQHLRRELDGLSSERKPVHGVIAWIEVVDIKRGLFRSHAMAAGRVREGGLSKFAMPMGRVFRFSIDHVELYVREGLEFNLSDGREEIAKLLAAIERSIPSEWSEAPSLGADLHIALDLETDEPPVNVNGFSS
jgi:hypothetical protein